jgi:DNA polymerase I-like protein with 3'-5' exonuclease and polymerase domains
MDNFAVIDFETDPIEARPSYPPIPRGVALRLSKVQRYDREFDYIKDVWNNKQTKLIFHNAPFDLAVAIEQLGLPFPESHRIYDTQVLAFFHSPYEKSLRLKDLASKWLGIPPSEQEDIRDWVFANIPGAKRAKTQWGRHIAKAPMNLQHPYAIGDVHRTWELFAHLLPKVPHEPVEREQRLLRVMMENSRQGIRVDLERLKIDLNKYERVLLDVDKKICKLLGCSFNVGSPDELADALEASGKGSGFLITKTGKRSVSKTSLAQCEIDPTVAELLNYRGRLETCLTTFMRNWAETAEASGGRVHFEWSSTRQDASGARTGRLSSSPNVQNIPKTWKLNLPKGLPELPMLRGYLLPDEGCIWLRKDYAQQELRMLAHFEDDILKQMYLDDPAMDMHQRIADMIGIDREWAKTLAFAILYGMGLTALAGRLSIEIEKATEIKENYLDMLPGVRKLTKELQKLGRNGEQIRTWGGRYYDVEPSAIIDGRRRTFEYKLINYLIQGSSADVTKEATCRIAEAGIEARLLVSCHDELDFSVPNDKYKLKRIREIDELMRSVEVDVPMLSSTEEGTSWANLSSLEI